MTKIAKASDENAINFESYSQILFHRFIGTTLHSSNLRQMLFSLMTQICFSYKINNSADMEALVLNWNICIYVEKTKYCFTATVHDKAIVKHLVLLLRRLNHVNHIHIYFR